MKARCRSTDQGPYAPVMSWAGAVTSPKCAAVWGPRGCPRTPSDRPRHGPRRRHRRTRPRTRLPPLRTPRASRSTCCRRWQWHRSDHRPGHRPGPWRRHHRGIRWTGQGRDVHLAPTAGTRPRGRHAAGLPLTPSPRPGAAVMSRSRSRRRRAVCSRALPAPETVWLPRRATRLASRRNPGRRRPDRIRDRGHDHQRRRPVPNFLYSGVRRSGRRGGALGVDTLERILHVRALDREMDDHDHEQQEPPEGDRA